MRDDATGAADADAPDARETPDARAVPDAPEARAPREGAEAPSPTADPPPGEEPARSGNVPGHASTVVVPLSNPDTAPDLLTLARAVVRSDGGRVIALNVVLGDADAELSTDRIEAVEQVVETFRARHGGVEVEVVTRPALSVARGILDATRDEGADMVVLGVQAPTPGEVVVGPIARQVIDTAECDVLIYRQGRHGGGLSSVRGIVVGVDHSDDARVAARLGIIMHLGLGLAEKVEMLHIRRLGESEDEAALTLDSALHGLEGEGACARTVRTASSPTAGLRSHVASNRLTVVGFHSRPEIGQTRLGNTTRGALDTLRGPVLAISRPQRVEGLGGQLAMLAARLRPRLTVAEEQSLVWHARLNATLSTDFVVLSVVAAMIASFGLILNSAAVIIGAMLVAPLMSPIVSFGTALVDGELRTLRRAGATVGVGSVLVAGTAVLIGLVAGPDTPTPEMLSRGSPSLVDAAVAAASGVVGGYAQARKGIPAALAGVAIAAALVPPICVFGLALTSDLRLATGSGLLFVTNIACIAAAAAGVLVWLGVHLTGSGSVRQRYTRFIAPVLGAVLSALVLFGLASSGPDLDEVRQLVGEALGPDVEVVEVDQLGPSDTVTVTVRAAQLPGDGPLDLAAQRVEEAFGLQLRIAVQQLVPAGS